MTQAPRNYHSLDNPVWHSLNEVHKMFCLDNNDLKFYHPTYCPFGAWHGNSDISNGLIDYARLVNEFYIVGEKPSLPPGITVKKELICLQMIIERAIDLRMQNEIIKLNDQYAQQLFDLINLVQPGYFKNKTMLLGDYFGIFCNDKLVSVTGERMKMNEWTEVSAVVTHPDHVGKGYARQLIAHTVRKIMGEGKNPYLHVAETNTTAISLYNKLGFISRRKISFWNLEKQ